MTEFLNGSSAPPKTTPAVFWENTNFLVAATIKSKTRAGMISFHPISKIMHYSQKMKIEPSLMLILI